MKRILIVLMATIFIGGTGSMAFSADYDYCVTIPSAYTERAQTALLTVWEKPTCKTYNAGGTCIAIWGDVAWLEYKLREKVKEVYSRGLAIQNQRAHPVVSDKDTVIPEP